MLYYIQYYIGTDNKYKISHQMSEEIIIDIWQQIPETTNITISKLIENYKFKKSGVYIPCYIFIKCENDTELKLLSTIFNNKITDIGNFNINQNIYNYNNILIININEFGINY